MSQTFRLPTRALGRCLLKALPLSALLLAATASAQIINYNWTGANSDNWATADNWNPGAIPGRTASNTEQDSATISGNVTVNSTAQILLRGYDATKTGTFNALSLLSGARLETSQAVHIRSTEDTTRNVLIGANSSLISTYSGTGIGIQAGSSNSTLSIWTINGTLETNSLGMYNSGATVTGGIIFNVDGGSLSVADSISFRYQSGTVDGSIAQIHISNNGFLNLGTINSIAHADGSNYYINFADGSGTFQLVNSNYSSLTQVQSLIQTGKIRLGGNVVGIDSFSIDQIENGWRVQSAIPEASTYTLLIAASTLLALVWFKRHRR